MFFTYDHKIIIRFSTIFEEREDDKWKNYSKDIFNEKKLDIRFNLFEKFCLWTITNQSLISYQVIIIYDKNLPEKYLNKLKDLTKNYEFIVLHEWNKKDKLVDNNWLAPYIDKTKNFLITTRFDDDDILNLKNNERLLNFINSKKEKLENKLISFSKGKFIYYENNKFRISECNYKTPALWLTYVTKIDAENNVYVFSHDQIKKSMYFELRFPNNFGIINHVYGIDKRIIRMKRKYKKTIQDTDLEKIYDMFSK